MRDRFRRPARARGGHSGRPSHLGAVVTGSETPPASATTSAPEPAKSADFLAPALQYSALIAAYLYLTGWIYLYHLYGHFRIEPGSLDISTQEAIAQSAIVLAGLLIRYVPTIGFFSVAVLAAMYAHFLTGILRQSGYAQTIKASATAVLAVGAGAALLLAVVTIELARFAANEKIRSIRYATNEPIKFRWTEACEKPIDPRLKALNDAERLRLVTTSSNWYFVFAKDGETIPDKEMVTLIQVFHIPTSCILSVNAEARPPSPGWLNNED